MNLILSQDAARSPAPGWHPGSEQRLMLDSVDWAAYVTIGDALPDRPRLRMTYDRGRLEFMTTSPEHERLKRWLSRLIETIAEEYNLPIAPFGSMTLRRPELDRGLEPDECYWIAHERDVRNPDTGDPSRDPPPDLVIEIEVSRSALNRMGIYAAMDAPEVWRFDGETFHIHLLQGDRTYQEAEASPTFPGLPINGIVPFAQRSETEDYLTRIRNFRTWVREQLARKSP